MLGIRVLTQFFLDSDMQVSFLFIEIRTKSYARGLDFLRETVYNYY